jgi:hypothetical protein
MSKKITPKFKIGQKVHVKYCADYWSNNKFTCGTIISSQIVYNTKLQKGTQRTTTAVNYTIQLGDNRMIEIGQKDVYSNKNATFIKARNDRKTKASRAFKMAENALKKNTEKLRELKKELKLLKEKKYENKK